MTFEEEALAAVTNHAPGLPLTKKERRYLEKLSQPVRESFTVIYTITHHHKRLHGREERYLTFSWEAAVRYAVRLRDGLLARYPRRMPRNRWRLMASPKGRARFVLKKGYHAKEKVATITIYRNDDDFVWTTMPRRI